MGAGLREMLLADVVDLVRGAGKDSVKAARLLGRGALVGFSPEDPGAAQPEVRATTRHTITLVPPALARNKLTIDMTAWLFDPPGLLGGLFRKVYTVGRGPKCHVRLAHSDVSALHARLIFKGLDATLVDMESANGTFVVQRRLTPHVGQPLRNWDRIMVGPLPLVYLKPLTLAQLVALG